MKIASKISLSFLITAVVLTGIAAPIYYTISKDELKKAILERLKTTSELKAQSKVLGQYEYIPETHWRLLAEMDEKETLAPLLKLRTIFLIVMLSVPISAWLIGIYVSRLITKPIYNLHKGTEIIGTGNLDYKVATSSKDEIGQLSRAVDKMTKDLKQTTTSITKLNKEIYERKKVEQELEKLYEELNINQAQLIQSAKMASIGRLAAGVAHEINNPLFAIQGEAEMLLKDMKIAHQTKHNLKIIREQAERIKTITERLLEFSRKKEFGLESLYINDVLEKALFLLNYYSRLKDIKVLKELDTALPKVLGDSNQLQEVFLNIMLNAVESMDEHGNLTIKSYTEKIKDFARRKTDIFNLGQEIVVIEFRDTGKGMDYETQKMVFDPFFSTKAVGNTGLGLYISYGIIRNHKGIIEVRSKLKEGSTFLVKIPLTKE